MIIATGNNFGAGTITLEEYQSPEICILNGNINLSPISAEFKAATILEIYLPDLPINKSATAFSYLLTSEEYSNYSDSSIVPLVTWIKDKNTLCLEKLTEWDNQTQIHIYIHTAFFPERIRKAITRPDIKTIPITSSNFTYTLEKGIYYEAENWIYLYLEFSKFTQATAEREGWITLGTMPLIKWTELPIIGLLAPGDIMGNACTMGEIQDNEIYITGLSQAMTGENTPVLITGFFLKNTP